MRPRGVLKLGLPWDSVRGMFTFDFVSGYFILYGETFCSRDVLVWGGALSSAALHKLTLGLFILILM